MADSKAQASEFVAMPGLRSVLTALLSAIETRAE